MVSTVNLFQFVKKERERTLCSELTVHVKKKMRLKTSEARGETLSKITCLEMDQILLTQRQERERRENKVGMALEVTG